MRDLKSAFKEKSIRLSNMRKESNISLSSRSTGHRLLPTAPKKTKLVSMDKNFAQRAGKAYQTSRNPISIRLSQFNPGKSKSGALYIKNMRTSTSRHTDDSPEVYVDESDSQFYSARRNTEA